MDIVALAVSPELWSMADCYGSCKDAGVQRYSPESGALCYDDGMTFTARVQNGRLVLDEPTTLPEGQLVELVIVESSMDATERSELVDGSGAPPTSVMRPLGMLRGRFYGAHRLRRAVAGRNPELLRR